jgi:hypothetical protein
MLSRPTRAATSVIWLKLPVALANLALVSDGLASKPFLATIDASTTSTDRLQILRTAAMEYFSLKRSNAADRGQSNLSSKVYVRSTKSGKVQKIVRELYLRQDIPCSSHLCRACLDVAPTDYSKKGNSCEMLTKAKLTRYSHPICAIRYASWNY